MTKSVYAKPFTGKSVVTQSAEASVTVMDPPVGAGLGKGFVGMGQAIVRQFSSLAGAWGFAAVTAFVTLFAACYSRADRDAFASYYGISASFVSVDPYSAILPTILALASAAVLYGVIVLAAVGVSVARHFSQAKSRKRGGVSSRWLRRLSVSKFNTAPEPKIVKTLPVLSLLVATIVALSSSYLAGDGFGRAEARHGKQLLVLSDPKWCPPRPVGSRSDCVIIASSGGAVLTRWIDPETGRLGSATALWPSLEGGAVTTAMWFPVIRSPIVQSAR